MRPYFLMMLLGLLIASCSATKTIPKVMEQDPSKGNRHAFMETSMGMIQLELFEKRAPQTTANFIKLAGEGYYDSLIFHRVIPGFMIQGGCPKKNGTGDPGYSIPDEFHPELLHDTEGILSMANAGPNTGGSQFFITHGPTPHLNMRHAVFGKVVAGMDVVNAIGAAPRDRRDKPDTDILILNLRIGYPEN